MTSLARAAVRRLRVGIVPGWELARLSVGHTETMKTVHTELKALRGCGEARPIFVRGEWGTGKTHLLSLVRAAAGAASVPTSLVDLNARSVGLNRPQHFYLPLMESISHGGEVGFRAVLSKALRDEGCRVAVRAFARSRQAGDLAKPLLGLHAEFQAGTPSAESEEYWGQLHGADLVWSDHWHKAQVALARLQAVGLLFRALDMGGLVVMLDEVETVEQLWNSTSRRTAYRVLASLCRMESIWCVFGVTDRFDQTVSRDWHSADILKRTMSADAADWFLGSWNREAFMMLRPPAIDVAAAQRLATAVVGLYKSAYSDAHFERAITSQCVDGWARNPGRNPRRLLRMLIDCLDAQRPLAWRR